MGLKQLFRVAEGKHAERGPDGKLKVYTKGQVVSSADDLVKKFENKFEKVHRDEVDPSLRRAMKAREEAAAREAEEEDEDKEVSETPEDEDDEVGTDVNDDESPDLGTDVSKKFEALAAKGLVVFYDGDNYSVQKDEDTVATGLEDKKAVVEWFKEWRKANKSPK